MKPTLRPGLTHRFTCRVPEHGVDPIGEGNHQRFIVPCDQFEARVADKAQKTAVSA
jgi:predicted thioesterase